MLTENKHYKTISHPTYKYLINLPEYEKYKKAIGPYEQKKDYSGPDKSWTKLIIPSTLYGINCNTAFYIHDARYEIGGGKKERWEGDCAMLIQCLWCIGNTPDRWYLWGANWGRKHLARNRAIKYFEAVRSHGHHSFNFTTK